MDNFERYHCQMALPGFGERAQQLLQKARVLIVGAGGLGCPAAQYLAAAGVGTIALADDDIVSTSNLHRQTLFGPADVGLPKVAIAAEKLRSQNPSIRIVPYNQRVTPSNVMELIAGFDLVIEGTDNFETKYLLNDACVLSGKPLIYGAIYQYEGQVGIWNVLREDGTCSPNYRDVFPDAENAQVPNCAEGGVIPTLAGIVGCMQANEAIKYLTDAEDLLAGKLWMIDVRDGQTRMIDLKKTTAAKITGLPGTTPTISFEEAQKEKMDLIDVRTREEHRTFHIGGENIPLAELNGRLDSLSFSRPVAFYCASGQRSAAAVRLVKGRFPAARAYSLKDALKNGINRVRE